MKRPLVFALIIALVLLAQIRLTHPEQASAQSESVFTLVSSEGEPLALISDYTLTDNQFCFTITNISGCKSILGIGPDFAQGAIKADDFSMTGPGQFILSPDRKLTDVNDQFAVDVAFALVVGPSLLGIPPNQRSAFRVNGDFKRLKAKNVAKNILVIAGIGVSCLSEPGSPGFSCGGVTAHIQRTDCDDLCVVVTNTSQKDAVASFVLLLQPPFGIFVPSGQTREFCGFQIGFTGTMQVSFSDGTSCDVTGSCVPALSEVLGGRGQ